MNRFRATGSKAQLELPMERLREPDRNLHKGGRSFYFFDFDDNIAFITTPIFLFHNETGAQIQLSSREFAQQSRFIGKEGPYADYGLNHDPGEGSFRYFRDQDLTWIEKILGRRQMFINDLAAALGLPDIHWKGPSWNCFYHAVFNERPLALITARGHHPHTIKAGIRLWADEGHLPCEPNYLEIYPVNHPDTKRILEASAENDVALLKQKAIRAAVLKAVHVYGYNPHHRFGMSDDDPRNIEWILKEMQELKREFKDMSFFIIQTHGDQMIKHEVFPDHVEDRVIQSPAQLSLFEE